MKPHDSHRPIKSKCWCFPKVWRDKGPKMYLANTRLCFWGDEAYSRLVTCGTRSLDHWCFERGIGIIGCCGLATYSLVSLHGAQSLGWCCVSGGLACCRLATYSLVPLHGCSELGLVLCFRWFGVMKVGSIQPSTLAWWVLRAWAGVVFQVGVL